MRKSRAYNSWANMIARCTNKNNKDFHYYGGRGITVCNEWRSNFSAFYDYLGEPPEGTTLDRIDNDKGYEPGNVRWAPHEVQQNNRRARGTASLK